jgi:beta-glucosidase
VNHHLLTEVLCGELGFKGFVVSDWEDIKKLVSTWRAAPDEKEATRLAVMAFSWIAFKIVGWILVKAKL